MIRMQGMNTLAPSAGVVDRGVDPVGPIADGALKVVAGLLLSPGFFTDASAFSCCCRRCDAR